MAERVVNAPEEGVVAPIGVDCIDVALKAPLTVHSGCPVLSLAGVTPPSLTMIASPESCVVLLSTAPEANVALFTAALSVAAVGLSPVAKVLPVAKMAMLGCLGD